AVAGWLLLPPADGPAAESTAGERVVANAYAALAELRHFAKPDTTYRARCDEDGSLTTKDAPFTDLVVLPLSDAAPDLAAGGFLRELLAPAARPPPAAGTCRTFGQARFGWPRRAVLRRAARRLAADLLDRWTTTDLAAVAGPVKAWMAEQWTGLALGPE